MKIETMAHDVPLFLLCVLLTLLVAVIARGRSRLVNPTFWGAVAGVLSVAPATVLWWRSCNSADRGSVGGAFGLMIWPWIAVAAGILGFVLGDLAGWVGVTIWGRRPKHE